MKFQQLVEEVMSGGAGSAFGPGVTSTSSAFSGDTYAPGDARNVHGSYKGVMTRSGMRKKNKTKKRRSNKS